MGSSYFGLVLEKSKFTAAITSLVLGSGLRLLLFFVTPPELAGLDTMIPPVVSFVAFIIVALATQKKHPGTERHGVIEYVPPEQDVVAGEDLKGYTSPSGLKFA